MNRKNSKVTGNSVFLKPNYSDSVMKNLLEQLPPKFDSILKMKDYQVQILYTQIDRGKNGIAKLTDHSYNLDSQVYFYPASTVKLPVAILALQKLNELNIPGLNKNTTMITEADYEGQSPVYNDTSSLDGRPTIEHYIKKILLVSDNDAFNRLYEFIGQEYINNNLHKLGYKDVEIIHRLDISMTEDQNRHTNSVKFFDSNNELIYEKPATNSQYVYAERNTKMGKGYYKGGQLVNEPFDFSKKNRMSLSSLHEILISIITPERVHAESRFNLPKDDYNFLHKYMSMMPRESAYPSYDSVNYWDTYVKFLFYGSEKISAIPEIRIFNKVGDAYGFLIDASYFVDFKNKVEFFLSAVIHCNRDEIFNDDKYDYDSIGFPFMKNLGKVVYDYEIKRKKEVLPDLSSFIFDYSQ